VPRDLLKLLASGLALLGGTLLLGLLLTHALLHSPVGRLDDSIESGLAAHRTAAGRALTSAGTALADPLNVEVALAVLVVLLAVLTRRVRPPLFLALAVGVESVIYFLSSTWVPRDRPHVPRLGPADPVASYPSGHAAASLCLYGGLAVLAWRCTRHRPLQLAVTAAAVVIPPLVGFSRMYRGFHHLTDVLAGLLLGATWLWLCTRYVLVGDGLVRERRR
jgi:membrane-associated phospholipid phosphatase